MKTNKKTNYAYVILVLLCAGILVPDFAQYQITPFGKTLMSEANLSPTQFASIATAPLLPGIFLSLISGILVDKLGARKVITSSIAISTLAIILRLFAKGFWSLFFSMIFIGFCATCINANAGKTLGLWFSPEKMGVGMGVFLAIASAGMALGTGTASLFSDMNGAFLCSAIIAVVVLIAWIFFMRNKPEGAESGSTAEEESTSSVKEGLKLALKSKTVWICASCLALTVGSMTALASFLPACLESRGLSNRAASLVATAVTLGSLTGCLVSPSLYPLFKRQHTYLLSHGVLAAFGLFIGWRLSDNAVVLFILMFLTGFSCSGYTPIVTSMPIQDPTIGTKYGGTAGGMLATLQLGGSVVIPTYIITPIATRADGTANYSLLFSLLGVLIIIFMVLSYFLPDKKAETIDK